MQPYAIVTFTWILVSRPTVQQLTPIKEYTIGLVYTRCLLTIIGLVFYVNLTSYYFFVRLEWHGIVYKMTSFLCNQSRYQRYVIQKICIGNFYSCTFMSVDLVCSLQKSKFSHHLPDFLCADCSFSFYNKIHFHLLLIHLYSLFPMSFFEIQL